MFMVNTYQWDYPMVAALVAPRPLLISNTDKDRIFPLDGVVDVHAKVRKIYELYDAGDRLGLHITEGPHKDTQELRIHAFRWFNRFLREDDTLIETAAVKFFEPEQLKVFEILPSDERVTNIHESFVPAVAADDLPQNQTELDQASEKWMNDLEQHVFRGWPGSPEPLQTTSHSSGSFHQIEFTSQSPYRLKLFTYQPNKDPNATMTAIVMDQQDWDRLAPAFAAVMPNQLPDVKADTQSWNEVRERHGNQNVAWLLPRGVGPTEWSRDERKRTQIRRRFMQLGQTAAAMQIYDVRRAIDALKEVNDMATNKLHLQADGEAAFWALYASLWTDGIDQLSLSGLPSRNREAPDLLNVSRFVELPHVRMMAESRVQNAKLE